jgi:hypothetical protein
MGITDLLIADEKPQPTAVWALPSATINNQSTISN